jgi:predicted RNase H-like HicB family nuclease
MPPPAFRSRGKELILISRNILGVDLEILIYGFKANITISDRSYSGEIDELHIITQAKSLKQLKQRLEEATELTIDALLKHPSEGRNYPSSISRKLGLKVYA